MIYAPDLLASFIDARRQVVASSLRAWMLYPHLVSQFAYLVSVLVTPFMANAHLIINADDQARSLF